MNTENTIKVISAYKTDILKEAKELNFYGKRIRDTKLTVCESIIRNLGIPQSHGLEACDLTDWLEENRPVLEKKAKIAGIEKPAASTMQGQAASKRALMPVIEGQRFIVTSAQNNTEAASVLPQLKQLAEDMEAKLLIMPIHYNKNAFSSAVEDPNEYYCAESQPYLMQQDSWLGGLNGVLLAVNAFVSPTAKQPVNAAKMLNAGEAITIVASPKQDCLPIPVMEDQNKRKAWTTGTCTNYNYTESRAGAEAETRHKFGALIIDVDAITREIFVTNVTQGNDGTLQTWEQCADDGIEVDVVLGDLHCEMKDNHISQLIKNWLEIQNVRNLAAHDILHFSTKSHHNRGSGKHNYIMAKLGKTVAKDLMIVADEINSYAQLAENVYLVESNHNSAIDNWLDDSKYSVKGDPTNQKLYHLLSYALCDTIDNEERTTGALEIALSGAFNYWETAGLIELDSNIEFGYMDRSERWSNVEISQHGHKGTNGSIGSTALFGKASIPMVTGHTHSPAIAGECFTVGCSASLKQGYNRGGLSSWDHANVVITPNGSRQLIQVLPTLY
jgi:hypothetical protein